MNTKKEYISLAIQYTQHLKRVNNHLDIIDNSYLEEIELKLLRAQNSMYKWSEENDS